MARSTAVYSVQVEYPVSEMLESRSVASFFFSLFLNFWEYWNIMTDIEEEIKD